MHKCITEIKEKCKEQIFLCVDGNYFNYYKGCNSICIEGGDNQYVAIAAASILAKVDRDKYIEELCEENPGLKEKYSIHTNKGYGAAKHIEGIKKYGISEFHRKSFGICRNY